MVQKSHSQPPGMCKTVRIQSYLPYQLVQDFFINKLMDALTKKNTTFLIDEFISTFGKSWSVRPPALLDYNLDLLNGNNNKKPSPNGDQIRKKTSPN